MFPLDGEELSEEGEFIKLSIYYINQNSLHLLDHNLYIIWIIEV